jgi:hypothetical protein
VNSWKVILATMVIFGAGVITGGLLVRHSTVHRPQRPPAATNAHPQAFTQAQLQRVEFLVRADRELDLTPIQRERVEKILRDGQETTRNLWDSVAPEIRKEVQLVRERIRVELKPEQRKRFEELMKKAQRPPRRDGATNAPKPEASPDLPLSTNPPPAPTEPR